MVLSAISALRLRRSEMMGGGYPDFPDDGGLSGKGLAFIVLLFILLIAIAAHMWGCAKPGPVSPGVVEVVYTPTEEK